MRLATLIIGLFLMCIVAFQSCAAGMGGSLTGDKATATAGSLGIFVALLYLIGSAFVMSFPLVSVLLFGLAALVGFTADHGLYADLYAWGFISTVLSLMSFAGWIGKRRSVRETRPNGQTIIVTSPNPQIARHVAALPISSRWAWSCPTCQFKNQPGTHFCGGCGGPAPKD